MTRHQDLATLQERGRAIRVLSQAERFLLVITEYKRLGMKTFTAPQDLENPDTERVRATLSAGTSMQPAVDVLNRAGIKTAANAGGISDALDMEVGYLHDIFCACRHETVLGHTVALVFDATATHLMGRGWGIPTRR